MTRLSVNLAILIAALKGKTRGQAEEEKEEKDRTPTKPYQAVKVKEAYLQAGKNLSGLPKKVALRPGLTVGRRPGCQVRLADPAVSRLHAEFKAEGPDWVIFDCASTNGTFVNGRKVSKAVLQSGDRIVIGRTVLIYRER